MEEKLNLSGSNKKEMKMPNQQDLMLRAQAVLGATEQLIHRSYLSQIGSFKPLLSLADTQLHDADTSLFKLERLVVENRQTILESATAAYTALGAAGYTVFFLLESNGKNTDFYIGARSPAKTMEGNSAGKLLQKTFNGHFPGSELVQVKKSTEIKEKLSLIDLQKEPTAAITAVTGIPALSAEERELFSQGLERFLDAAEGEIYSGLILAEPVSTNELNQARTAFEVAASNLSPLLKQQLSYGINESEAVGQTLTEGVSTSLAETVGQTVTKGTSYAENSSIASGKTEATTSSSTSNHNILKRVGGFIFGNKTPGSSNTVSQNYSTTKGMTSTNNQSKADNQSNTNTESKNSSKAASDTLTSGSSQQINLESVNKSVESLLRRIDQHLSRLDEAKAYGGWQTAAYFIGKDTETSKALGSTFLGLMRGQGSAAEDSSLTTWNRQDKDERKKILKWLSNLTHPRFKPEFLEHTTLDYVTPAALLSGRELAIQLSLPRCSAAAVTVLEVAAFGRSIDLLDLDKNQDTNNDQNSVLLGELRHLWKDTHQPLYLSLDKLCYHTLVTGTTGVGKTTAVMSILAQVHKLGIPFLAIEPAKGEYKKLLGLATDKQKVTYKVVGRMGDDALKINPFIFPEGIELSDHIDRVSTIFNAAFPMYAAMPQILEEAIYAAYEELGWDSFSSTCVGGVRKFPTLSRLVELIPEVVKNIGYSDQVNSDYVGALTARLRSLCRGSLGVTLQCSAEEETTDENLFEASAIVDLSSMGAPEKRALIMGVLFMRMYEKRIVQGLPESKNLKHLMVLEEAHVLLKRTATEQNQEGSNPRGLAVEAFANALAEMRAYGQGFIVADQSASVLDDAVLRNTNTKIVMRAPFAADREALGGALALNEDQTKQLARLENQTAVVHQSNWLEPVLCRIKRVDISDVIEQEEQKLLKKESRAHLKKIIFALWRDYIGDLVNENINLTEQEVEASINQLRLGSELVNKIKPSISTTQKESKTLDLEVLKYLMQCLIPEINTPNLKYLSKQGAKNRLGTLLEQKAEIYNPINNVICLKLLKSYGV